MALAPLSAGFQSLPLLPTIKLGPSGADSRVGGLVHTLGPCGSLWRTLLWGWEFLLLPPQPPRVFSISGLRLYFPTLEPWVAPVCHPVHQLLPHQPAAPLPTLLYNLPPRWVHQPQPCQESSPLRLPVSAPSTSLDECFFFISLVVGLPRSWIFCQFWFFFVFKLLLSFFWLCEEAQCVYLYLRLGRESHIWVINISKKTTITFDFFLDI